MQDAFLDKLIAIRKYIDKDHEWTQQWWSTFLGGIKKASNDFASLKQADDLLDLMIEYANSAQKNYIHDNIV